MYTQIHGMVTCCFLTWTYMLNMQKIGEEMVESLYKKMVNIYT